MDYYPICDIGTKRALFFLSLEENSQFVILAQNGPSFSKIIFQFVILAQTGLSFKRQFIQSVILAQNGPSSSFL